MGWPPHITVAAIVHRQDEFLMVEEMDAGLQVVNQPAGHVEPGETIQSAVLREVLEETGWEVRLQAFCGHYEYYAANQDILYHRMTFAAEPLHQITEQLDPDILRASWMSVEEISKARHRSPLVMRCLNDFLNGQKAPLSFVQSLGTSII